VINFYDNLLVNYYESLIINPKITNVMFKLILSGVLGNDAEVKEVGSSKDINFNVAVSMDYIDILFIRLEKGVIPLGYCRQEVESR
jgi:hypothetical protein